MHLTQSPSQPLKIARVKQTRGICPARAVPARYRTRRVREPKERAPCDARTGAGECSILPDALCPPVTDCTSHLPARYWAITGTLQKLLPIDPWPAVDPFDSLLTWKKVSHLTQFSTRWFRYVALGRPILSERVSGHAKSTPTGSRHPNRTSGVIPEARVKIPRKARKTIHDILFIAHVRNKRLHMEI